MFFTRKLDPAETQLWQATLEAHRVSAYRSNYSTETVVRASIASGNYVQGVAAAILTLGGEHAPLIDTYDLLQLASPLEEARMYFGQGMKVPGWGNSFEVGHRDPLWLDVEGFLRAMAPATMRDAEEVTDFLHGKGKLIFPNPSFYTAAVAIRLGVPRRMCPAIFLQGRLEAWSDIIERNTEKLWEQPLQPH